MEKNNYYSLTWSYRHVSGFATKMTYKEALKYLNIIKKEAKNKHKYILCKYSSDEKSCTFIRRKGM